ncbi:hypothetical protein BC567DRAFT_238168 [Phyllosticta citribraziliensis]
MSTSMSITFYASTILFFVTLKSSASLLQPVVAASCRRPSKCAAPGPRARTRDERYQTDGQRGAYVFKTLRPRARQEPKKRYQIARATMG